MNCDKAMERVLEVDADGRLPIAVRLHLTFCPSCAEETRRLNAALSFMKTEYVPASPDLSARIASAIDLSGGEETAPISFRKWIAVGLTILAAMLLSPLGKDFGWIEETFGTGFLLPLNIVLGLVLAVYCALFIGTHLTEFSERLGLPRLEKRV